MFALELQNATVSDSLLVPVSLASWLVLLYAAIATARSIVHRHLLPRSCHYDRPVLHGIKGYQIG